MTAELAGLLIRLSPLLTKASDCNIKICFHREEDVVFIKKYLESAVGVGRCENRLGFDVTKDSSYQQANNGFLEGQLLTTAQF